MYLHAGGGTVCFMSKFWHLLQSIAENLLFFTYSERIKMCMYCIYLLNSIISF